MPLFSDLLINFLEAREAFLKNEVLLPFEKSTIHSQYLQDTFVTARDDLNEAFESLSKPSQDG